MTIETTYECHWCGGTGEVGESPDGANWYAVPCEPCNGTGATKQRYVRSCYHDKRVANGDDFSGDAWSDLETRQIVYGAVGHDLNSASYEEKQQ